MSGAGSKLAIPLAIVECAAAAEKAVAVAALPAALLREALHWRSMLAMADSVPDNPKVYHITHVKNLPLIVGAGGLASDRRRIDDELPCDLVGMASIKQRRLTQIQVTCHAGSYVGEYVPFYLCPRSIMLYILYRGNHPEITYHGGQGPIVHLQADLRTVVEWANAKPIAWAITDGNAGAHVTQFSNDLADLDRLNWEAIHARDWRDAKIKEQKQAEFLLRDWFPWELVECVGVQNDATLKDARAAVATGDHRPVVRLEPEWYY